MLPGTDRHRKHPVELQVQIQVQIRIQIQVPWLQWLHWPQWPLAPAPLILGDLWFQRHEWWFYGDFTMISDDLT